MCHVVSAKCNVRFAMRQVSRYINQIALTVCGYNERNFIISDRNISWVLNPHLGWYDSYVKSIVDTYRVNNAIQALLQAINS